MQVKKNRKNRYAVPIGGIFIALAFIGVIAIIAISINLTTLVLDNSSEKQKLEQILKPVVMFDPVPFENPSTIVPEQMLLYAMWSCLIEENTYTYDENAELLVPPSDLDVAAARLFGPEIVLDHKTFRDDGDYQTTYFYDPERKIYSVPVNAQLYVYTPQVQSIESAAKKQYTVRVGYIPPSNAWTINLQGNKGLPKADKTMIYLVEKTGNTYQILSIYDDLGTELDTTHKYTSDSSESSSSAIS